ncbi:MAG TPA: prepilin-type N-terminal cleavage/methylation domain-containing protein [candidate division Zixibacteria bacterium]|nr:prepilin-type N-terminal cleavage/methylation domain-containing protein [candidate division Zixibacteria bacterium]MDD4916232.1 prepilin-type N-terminal cleavage/methylation domain-containing protein [candidate division Zixibacteria bacterium]MDM7972752.1 prepilin-type N-terminal cleavage/methylation domain-containing protein [candidate division Zixibacteria bacterium]HOD67026.1 prepilin-type N-terminal cleavage/methylation domain-containing protein [candidate division Zixibacteria bacterium]
MGEACRDNRGMSLIELLVVIVVIGILVAAAMQAMTATLADLRRVRAERDLEALARAIVGDPVRTAGGARWDFGFVGDNGAFPPDLAALRANPGGWVTWNGPYLDPGFDQDTLRYRLDPWGAPYQYVGGLTVISTGSGAPLVQRLADDAADYLANTYEGLVRDAADSVPSSRYRDSVSILLTVPNGAGAWTILLQHPDSAGRFAFSPLPVGTHLLRIVFTPRADTLLRCVTVLPRHRSDPPDRYRFTEAWFSGGTP